MNHANTKSPRHLWIVGILAVLWNAIGAFDYSASQLRLDFYVSQFTPEQLEYFYGFPTWAVACWAIAVWGSLLGSILMLLRQRLAVPVFGIAIVAMVLTTVQNYLLSEGLRIMGSGAAVFSAVIGFIALFLFFYSRAMATRGVLR
jgi:hypothetical protein